MVSLTMQHSATLQFCDRLGLQKVTEGFESDRGVIHTTSSAIGTDFQFITDAIMWNQVPHPRVWACSRIEASPTEEGTDRRGRECDTVTMFYDRYS
jgi:hypothetical protein